MKVSLDKIVIVAVVLLLPLSIVHNITIKAETAADGSNIDNTGATSEVVGKNDAQKSVIPISQYDIKAGVPITTKEGIEVNISNPGGGDLVKTTVFYPLNVPIGENGKQMPLDKSMFNFGNDALKDGVATKNYGANAFANLIDSKALMTEKGFEYVTNEKGDVIGIEVNYEGSKSAMENISVLTESLTTIIEDNGTTPADQLLSQLMEKLDMTPEHPNYDKYKEAIEQAIKDPNMAKESLEALQKQLNMFMAMSFQPPEQTVHTSTVPSDGGACAEWNAQGQPAPVTCLGAGTQQGQRANCSVSQTQEFMSSYTTTTPNNSDPFIKNRSPFCDSQRGGYLNFSEIMNTFGHRVWSKDDLMNNGVSAFNRVRMQDQFTNNPWKSSWRGEMRRWNPFKEGNKLSGIPYKILWSPVLDSWTDADHRINPMITESIEHRDKAERSNAAFTAKYGLNDPLKVYNNAPNPRMRVTALDLNNNAWNESETANIFCAGQYDMKIEPRYDIQKWDRYRLFDLHKTDGPSWTFKCQCVEEREEEYCKGWTWEKDSNGRRSRTCDEWGTRTVCVREEHVQVNLGGVNEKYPKGSTTSGPTPAGSIPPIYKQRRKYQYRIGALVEYHAIARNTMNPRLRPVPNSYRDPSKIKAGYGFNYTSGMQVITDYDRDPRTYNASPVIIRPNKARPLNLARDNYLGNYGRFNPNVRYDSVRNAPERSSSINQNFIEEDLRGGIIGTTFNPNEISNVEKVDGKMRDLKDVEQLPVSPSVRRTPINWNNRTTSFRIDSDPNKYYHAYWRTRGEENLVPAYRPGPLHYIYLDYLSGTDYTVGSLEFIRLNNRGFGVSAFNSGSIRVVGNMWEDAFSRPDFRKSRDFNI